MSGGPALQPALFSGLQLLTPSTTDVASEDNRVTARFELHRALDRGNDADLLAWARRWGEALTDGIEQHVVEAEYLKGRLDESNDWNSAFDRGRVQEVEDAVESAKNCVIEAKAQLALRPADIEAADRELDEALDDLKRALKDIDTL